GRGTRPARPSGRSRSAGRTDRTGRAELNAACTPADREILAPRGILLFPSPPAGEGGSLRAGAGNEPGEGFFLIRHPSPGPRLRSDHPLPQGERESAFAAPDSYTAPLLASASSHSAALRMASHSRSAWASRGETSG